MTSQMSPSGAIPTTDELGVVYVHLALAIEQHVPGYIDAYFGPAGWKAEAEHMGKSLVADLAARARELAEAVAAWRVNAQRRRFLSRQIEAMRTTLRILAGEPVPFVEEVEHLYDVTPARTDDSELDAALSELEKLLPGEGTLAERRRARRQHFEISSEVSRALFAIAQAETRRRTTSLFSLPAGEDIELSFVQDKPWAAYNWYLGHYRSLIEVNTDSRAQANNILHLITHEGYPGHHTEHAIKEQINFERESWAEACILLINAPECVVSEGIATSAQDVLFADGEAEAWQRAELYPRANLSDPLSIEALTRIESANEVLGAVSDNAAFMLHVDQRPAEEVIAYLLRYSGRTREEAERSLRFLSHPLFRSYSFTYSVGRRRFRQLFEQHDKVAVFRRALSEPLTPSDLLDWSVERAS
jgi:hypothetical protein